MGSEMFKHVSYDRITRVPLNVGCVSLLCYKIDNMYIYDS